MKIIECNPYRQLGVYANSPVKERVANHNKLTAFLKVGKEVDFPLDLNSYLPPIVRTAETVAQAEKELALPNEQIKYAQFWFIKATPLDDVAFNHLLAGNIDAAISIWQKKDCASSLQNRITCALIGNDLASAVACAEQLYAQFSQPFVATILDTDGNNAYPTLALDFIDRLCEEAGADTILPLVTDEQWKEHIAERLIAPLIANIQAAIDATQTSRGKGCTARYNAGVKLKNDTKKPLSQLKTLLNDTDLQYQMVADKLAQEILQCSIDYFNDTEDDDAPQKAYILQNYALSIAVGKLVKDRCKENVDILNKIGKEHIVRKELAQLSNCIKDLRNKHSSSFSLKGISSFDIDSISSLAGLGRSISDIKNIVDKATLLLETVKTKLGSTNNLYIKVSSAIASSAINALVEIVNFKQSLLLGDKDELRKVIREAVALMSILGQLDMDSKTRNYYNGNKSTLDNINDKLNPSGCYIATMIYGNYDHPQVLVLRNFRDKYLATRDWGQKFIQLYYKYSPKLVERLKMHNTINHIIKIILDCFIRQLKRHNY